MKVAIYGRYAEKRGRGQRILNQQIEKQKQYAKQNNHEIVGVYTDFGVSGNTLNRAGLTELRKQVTKRQFEAILMQDGPKLSRSLQDFRRLYEQFKKYNVQLVFTDYPHSTMAFDN